MSELIKKEENLYDQIKEILTSARAKAYSAVNFAMVEAYWLIGKQIVETQAGNERAEYGTQLLKYLSQQLTLDFGKGFEERELRKIRQFYLAFPIRDALRPELESLVVCLNIYALPAQRTRIEKRNLFGYQ
jgi:hypothetical protein